MKLANSATPSLASALRPPRCANSDGTPSRVFDARRECRSVPRPKRRDERNTEAGQEKINILLVDNQQAKLLTYEAILDELGENLIKASSATEALEQLLKCDIAIMLFDVCMPDLDGFQLATMIREHPRFQSLAIIFVSAVQVLIRICCAATAWAPWIMFRSQLLERYCAPRSRSSSSFIARPGSCRS